MNRTRYICQPCLIIQLCAPDCQTLSPGFQVLIKQFGNCRIYGLISIGVPSGTSRQISSIALLETAMQPLVQSWYPPISSIVIPSGSPCIIIELPGETPRRLASKLSVLLG